jgi:glycosyltransferase involved in cell wall biosynthesis
MNVLFIYPPAAAIARGGLWTQVEKSAEALRSSGIDVDMMSVENERSFSSYDLCHVIGANMATYHTTRELYRRGVPFVVSPVFFSRHSPSFLRSAVLMHSFLRKIVPGVWTDYGFIAEMARWSRAVFPNTQAEAHLLRRGLDVPEEKLHVVPNGVDERFYFARPDEFRNRYGMQDFVLNVGYFGERRKNTLRLIRTLHSIDRPAVLIGRAEDPGYYERCRREAAKNPRLMLLDEIAGDSELLASAYAACDVFVLPSLYETPGIAALEAALAGAKIVITRYGGTMEYFGTWAEYVEPTSEQSIARGIRSALRKPKSNELREHIRRNYLWKNLGARIADLYRQILR